MPIIPLVPVPAFHGKMAEAATEHSKTAHACQDASEFAYEESNEARVSACKHRLDEEQHTKESNTAYLKAKANSKLQKSFPNKEQHFTLACHCTTFKDCKTARGNAKMGELQALDQDAEHQRAEHQRAEHQRAEHLYDARHHDRWASTYRHHRIMQVDRSRICLAKSSYLRNLASRHELANMYKEDQTHGGEKPTNEHKEMLSHSVHDAKKVIGIIDEIKNNIQYRKDAVGQPPPYRPGPASVLGKRRRPPE